MFIKDIIEALVAAGGVDPKRVFATGMSNGAFMAQRLACELAGQITAVASVSGSLVLPSCTPARAVSIIEMHGLADRVVPFDGGAVGGLTSFSPTMSIMRNWASIDGCAVGPTTSKSGITTIYAWSACRDGSSVVLETIGGAGHSWFSPREMASEPDASQVVWNFLDHAPPLA
jgi:polyhydroxybutyrate depolymerase